MSNISNNDRQHCFFYTPSMQQMVGLHRSMKDGDRLQGGLFDIYVDRNRPDLSNGHDPYDKPSLSTEYEYEALSDGSVESDEQTASVFNNTRARRHVRNFIANQVGNTVVADKFMRKILGLGESDDIFAAYNNQTAMTKEQLGQAIDDVYTAKIQAMSLQNRERLIQLLEPKDDVDPSAFVRDKEAIELIQLVEQQKKGTQTRRTQFLRAVEAFEASQQKANKPGQAMSVEDYVELLQQTKNIYNDFLDEHRADSIDIHNSNLRNDLSSKVNADVRDLTEEWITLRDIRTEVLAELRRSEVRDLVYYLKTCDTVYGKVLSYDDPHSAQDSDDEQSNRTARDTLEHIENSLNGNSHVRKSGNFLYTKSNFIDKWYDIWNHAKSIFTFRRARKFAAAKQSVRTLVKDALLQKGHAKEKSEYWAEKIMQPWSSSQDAIGNQAMLSINGQLREHKNLRKMLQRLDPHSLNFDRCVTQNGEATKAFDKYLELQGQPKLADEFRSLDALLYEIDQVDLTGGSEMSESAFKKLIRATSKLKDDYISTKLRRSLRVLKKNGRYDAVTRCPALRDLVAEERRETREMLDSYRVEFANECHTVRYGAAPKIERNDSYDN